jgi:hypothetical protein
MSDLIALTPLYIPLIQKPMCCAVTCLQMLLFRNGYGLQDQEVLAVKFGVKITPKYADRFSSQMIVGELSNQDYGISTVESGDYINDFLRDHAPGLHASAVKSSNIVSLPLFLNKHIGQNHDLWVEYHAPEIYADDEFQGDYVHDSLIESFCVSRNEVTIVDPMYEHRQRLVVPLALLERGISSTFGRETGFIVIEKR